MYKICLLSDHHLCVNPRLWKEAFFYEKEKYEVVVINMWQSNDLFKKDMDILKGHSITYKCYLNLIPREASSVARFYYRFRKRIASEVNRFLKIESGWAISHAPELMLECAFKENADLYIAHLECGFYVGRELIKAGRKVSFDFEDWYSRDYLTSDRAVNLLAKLEKFALHFGAFCTAPSISMADALMQTYSSPKKITVIYNSFPDEELICSTKTLNEQKINKLRLIWTSRTIGHGRGLEILLKSIEMLTQPIELHLIGKCSEGYDKYLEDNWPSGSGHDLILHDFIPHADLLKTIAGYDLGLAIEHYEPDNKNKTISNKILQYLQAGIKVLATDTDGQREIAECFPDSVILVSADNPKQWKDRLEELIMSSIFINKNEQLSIYKEKFSWPIQEKKLKKLISEIL